MNIDPQSPAFRAAQLGALLARHYPDATTERVADTVTRLRAAASGWKKFHALTLSAKMAPLTLAAGARRQERDLADLNATLLDDGLRGPAALRADKPQLHPSPATVTPGGDVRGPGGRLHVPGTTGDGFAPGWPIY